MNRKLLLSFITSEENVKTKTINNVRVTATDEQLKGFASMYSSLTADTHSKTTVVESRVL